jgi:hypothetical protein
MTSSGHSRISALLRRNRSGDSRIGAPFARRGAAKLRRSSGVDLFAEISRSGDSRISAPFAPERSEGAE